MQFINPIFLFALATAMLPVLYHLVRRIQAKKVPFSSLMFLKMTPEEVVRRRRIQHWLLMAMRCMLLALLAFAFTRPFIPRESIPFISQREDRSVVLLIDNSYSMQYGNLFEEARAAAIEQLDEAAGEDEYSIVVFSNESRQMSPLSSDMALHRNMVENVISPSYRLTDFYKPLRLAEEILGQARHEKKSVVLISDVQLAGWHGAFENWKLNKAIDFEIVALGDEDPSNVFVDDFSLSEKRVEGQVVNRFDLRVAGEGEAIDQAQSVVLELEGERVDQAEIPVSALRRASFQHSPTGEGYFQGDLRLPDDDLPADNAAYFTFEVTDRPKIVGFGGALRDARRSAYYLDRAFNQGEAALYTFNVPPSQQVRASVLRDLDAVFLYTDNISAAEVAALTSYVEDGGSVVVAFDEGTNAGAYRSLLETLGVGRLDAVVRPASEQGYDAIIGEVDLRHPVFSIFAESGSGAIFRPRFRQYVRVAADSAASVLGRYDSGDPFLIERSLGQGKVLVYTSSLSPSWTDFTISELYVPFLYQLTRYALESRTDQRMFKIGDVVRLEGRPGTEWNVRAPGDLEFIVEIDEEGYGFFRETEVPGHYVAAGGGEQYFFSVNVDPQESLLERRNVEEALAAVIPPPDDAPVSIELAKASALDDEERQQKFWRYVILFMVGLYVAETFLANRKQKR